MQLFYRSVDIICELSGASRERATTALLQAVYREDDVGVVSGHELALMIIESTCLELTKLHLCYVRSMKMNWCLCISRSLPQRTWYDFTKSLMGLALSPGSFY